MTLHVVVVEEWFDVVASLGNDVVDCMFVVEKVVDSLCAEGIVVADTAEVVVAEYEESSD